METLDCSASLTHTRCAEGQYCDEALAICMPCDLICNVVYSERCPTSCPGYIRSPVAAPATTAGWAEIKPMQSAAAQTIIIITVLVTLMVIVLVAVLVYCVRKRAILPNHCRKLIEGASKLATRYTRTQAPSAAVQQHASSLIKLLSQRPQLTDEADSTLRKLAAIVKKQYDLIDCHKEDVFRQEDETKTPLMPDDTISQPGGACIMAGEVDSSSPVSNSENASIPSHATATRVDTSPRYVLAPERPNRPGTLSGTGACTLHTSPPHASAAEKGNRLGTSAGASTSHTSPPHASAAEKGNRPGTSAGASTSHTSPPQAPLPERYNGPLGTSTGAATGYTSSPHASTQQRDIANRPPGACAGAGTGHTSSPHASAQQRDITNRPPGSCAGASTGYSNANMVAGVIPAGPAASAAYSMSAPLSLRSNAGASNNLSHRPESPGPGSVVSFERNIPEANDSITSIPHFDGAVSKLRNHSKSIPGVRFRAVTMYREFLELFIAIDREGISIADVTSRANAIAGLRPGLLQVTVGEPTIN